MALKVFEADRTLDEIAQAIDAESKRIVNALQALTTAKDNLDGMTATYAAFVSALNAEVSANPSNEVWQDRKRTKDQYVTEFGNKKTYATDLETAAAGVSEP